MIQEKQLRELLLESMQHANNVSELLNSICHELYKIVDDGDDSCRFDKIFDLLQTRFNTNSGLPLFIKAGNLGIELEDDGLSAFAKASVAVSKHMHQDGFISGDEELVTQDKISSTRK